METKLTEGYIISPRGIPEECPDCGARPFAAKVIVCPHKSSLRDVVCKGCERFIREFDGD